MCCRCDLKWRSYLTTDRDGFDFLPRLYQRSLVVVITFKMCLIIELGVGFRWPPRLGNIVGLNEKRDQIPNEREETISRGAAR